MSKIKSLVLWIVIFLGVILAWTVIQQPEEEPRWITPEELRAHVDAGDVARVVIHDDHLAVRLWHGELLGTTAELTPELSEALSQGGVEIAWHGEEEEDTSLFTNLFIIWGPILLIVALWLYFMKRMGGSGGGNIFQLRKTTARVLEEKAKATFADVGGCEDAKEHLDDVVSYLRDPKPWVKAGARLPRGTLLEGPPGCGKTLLARAVAGETRATFFYVAASEFVEMFVGVGAARVRDLFETARKKTPAVIFIDELDAVGRRRGSGIGASHDEREQTLNQLLVCLDGLERTDGLVVIAATNRPDVLDPALLRPGRMDRRLAIPPFDQHARRQILDIHLRDKKLAAGVDLGAVVSRTSGWSGADLESLVNEATVFAVRRGIADGGEPEIGGADFDRALEERSRRERTFDRLDQLMIESASQLSEAGGAVRARFVLDDGTVFDAAPLWADSAFLKVRTDDGLLRVIAKRHLRSAEPLAGTESVDRGEVAVDRMVGRMPDLA